MRRAQRTEHIQLAVMETHTTKLATRLMAAMLKLEAPGAKLRLVTRHMEPTLRVKPGLLTVLATPLLVPIAMAMPGVHSENKIYSTIFF